MEPVETGSNASAALIWIGCYLAIWGLLLWLSPQFREGFVDWLRLKDPFGWRFWRQNILFAAFSLCYLAVGLLFLGL